MNKQDLLKAISNFVDEHGAVEGAKVISNALLGLVMTKNVMKAEFNEKGIGKVEIELEPITGHELH